MKKTKFLIAISLIISLVWACKKEQENTVQNSRTDASPILPQIPYDYTSDPTLPQFVGVFNSQTITDDMATLGRVLFYDKALSFNNTLSCGSCHKQQLGFADNVKFHKGIYNNTLKRNTLSITGNSSALFWDARSNDMTDLVLRPVGNHDEMLQNIKALPAKLKSYPYYKDLFMKAYGSETIDLAGIESALASFCVKIVPKNSRFDAAFQEASMGSPFFFEITDKTNFTRFSVVENNGMNLFFGKGRCSTCHHFEPSGGYNSPAFENIGLDLVYTDNGMGANLNSPLWNGKFKTPNLRNVALTAPYMHDGRFATLEDVIDHYNGKIKPNENLSFKLYQAFNPDSITQFDPLTGMSIVPNFSDKTPMRLNLSDDDKKAIVAFLNTLTDNTMKTDKRFSNPF